MHIDGLHLHSLSTRGSLISILVLVFCFGPSPDAWASTCSDEVQGRIAWDYRGSTSWSPANVERLCRGGEDSIEPARCFQRVMHGGVDHGGGTRWSWQDALSLCAGTLDHGATVDCFREKVRSGLQRPRAIESCQWDAGSSGSGGGASVLVGPAVITPPPIHPLPRSATWRSSRAEANRVAGVAPAAASHSLGGVVALQDFRLFYRGDHKIRRITVLPEGRFARFALNDKEGEDYFWGRGTWAVASSGRSETLSAAAQGQVELDLGERPAGHAFALAGFELRRQDGTDANVRSLGVWYVPEENQVRVWLIDDMGFDFRGLEETLGASLTAGALVPFGGAIGGGLASTWDALSRFTAQGGERPYHAIVHYSWLPEELLGEEGAASGIRARNEDGFSPGGPHVLQGFQFTFNNSDHHLKGLGVTLGAEDNILFQDDGRDDAMQWAVQYRRLRPDRER